MMNSLFVLMNGVLVGSLNKHRKTGALSFFYDSSWLASTLARPISLSLPLSHQVYQGDRVLNFFDNLLPDDPKIRARIQSHFQAQSNQAFDLLANIGRDCVGAIQLTSAPISFEKNIGASPLSEIAIAELLTHYRESPLGMSDEHADFRISLAGAQEKLALLWQNNSWCYPLGATPTTHIFKLPIGYIEHQHIDLQDSCENEWICNKIAAAFGLPVPNIEIATFAGVKALIVERFDRQLSQDGTWIIRLPQEDFCQALGYSSNLKYEADGGPGIVPIMKFLLGSQQANRDREQFMRSQILFWLLGAIDGHAKNFSIFIQASGLYRLTPLYDILSVYPLIEKGQLQRQKVKMAMSLIGKNRHYHLHTVQRRHFLSTAEAAQYSINIMENLLEDMLSQVEQVIEVVRNQLPENFPAAISESIFAGMLNMKKRLET